MATAEAEYLYDVELRRVTAPPVPSPTGELRQDAVTFSEVARPALGRFEAAERYGEPRVLLDIETTAGTAAIELPLHVRNLDSGGTQVAGRAYRLWLRLSFDADGGHIDWRLDPGGQDASGRARIVDFLIALRGRGALVVKDPDAGAIAQLHLPGSTADPGLGSERRFLTDVLVVEAWSGMRFHVPDAPSDTDLATLGQLLAWVHEPVAEARFTGPITAVVAKPLEGADRLELHQEWRPLLFGLPVRMGQFDYDVAVRYDGAERLEDGRFRATFTPLGDGAVPARLRPPFPSSAEAAARAAAGELPEQPPRPASSRRETTKLARRSGGDGRRDARRRRAHRTRTPKP